MREYASHLKILLPIAAFLLEKVHYNYHNSYGQRILVKLSELYGRKSGPDNLKLFIAEKLVYFMLSVFLILLIGCFGEADIYFFLLSLVVLGLVLFYSDYNLDKQVQKRRRDIQIELPEFLSKMALLVNAGMTVSGAIKKIGSENRKDTPLFYEISILVMEMNAGIPDIQCFENFSKRCRVSEVTQFVSTLIQNLRKGNAELVSILCLFSNNCWENRKNIAKRLGEEASTKLILPMVIIFIAIALMVATPALITIGGL